MKTETFDSIFADVYKQNVLFLQIQPKAAVPFPQWMVQLYVAYEVENSSSGEVFWKVLSPESLNSAGYGASQHFNVIIEMLKVKFTTILKGDLALDEQFHCLISSMPAGVDADIKEEAQDVLLTAHPENSEVDDLEIAVSAITADKATFSKTLSLWPRGQSLIKVARGFCEGRRAASRTMDDINSGLDDAINSLKDPTTIPLVSLAHWTACTRGFDQRLTGLPKWSAELSVERHQQAPGVSQSLQGGSAVPLLRSFQSFPC